MLLQLEVEHALEEHGEFKFACLRAAILLVVHHGSSHSSPSLAAASGIAHQIAA